MNYATTYQRFPLFILFFFTSSLFCFGQLEGDIKDWPVRAYEIFESQGEQEGIKAFQQGLRVALQQGAHEVYLELIYEYGSAYTYVLNQPETVIQTLSQVYKLPFEPKTEGEFMLLSSILMNMGYSYSNDLGLYAEAFLPYQKAYDIFETKLKTQSVYRALYLEKPLGNICTRLGDYSAAEVHLELALNILEKNQEYEGAAHVCSDLGLLYQSWEKSEQAQMVYEKGLGFPKLSSLSKVLLLINYSDFLLEDEAKRRALKMLQQAESIIDQASEEAISSGRKAAFRASIFEKEALIQADLKNYAAAQEKIEKAISVSVELYGTSKRREIAKLYNKLGQILNTAGKHEQAIEKHQFALQCIIPQFQPQNSNDLPDPSRFYAENTIMEALENMATVYFDWHKAQPDTRLLEYALRCHERLHEVDKALQRSYLYETSKLFNLEESRHRSEKAIRVAYQLYQQTKDKDYLYQAFVFAERNRSSLLREAFQVTQANELAGISAAEQEEEIQLKRLVGDAEEELFRLRSEGGSDSLMQAAEQELLRARDALSGWIKQLETLHPRYYQLKYADKVPSLKEIQQMLSRKEVLIEYFVGQENIFVFKFDRNGLSLHKLELPNQLDQRVILWRQAIENYQLAGADQPQLLADYQNQAYQLYQELLEPILSKVSTNNRLLIISSGILDLLPFEALLTEAVNKNTSLNSYPYLLRDYEISYSYAASLHWSLLKLPRAGEQQAGFAPNFDGSGGWPSLSCSTNLLEGTIEQTGGKLLKGPDANIANFSSLAKRYRLLHLATHAQANPEQGDFSFIVFSDGQGGYDSLFAKDLYLYDIKAELVILSACETALGTLYNSEGVISLARAFHYAGARSVLTTLWRINEGANCNLLQNFYAALADGQDKTSALHSAKLSYLAQADPRAAHPVYWAGFQLLGNPRPIDEPINWVWFALGGLVLIVGGWGLSKRRKREVAV